MVYITASKTRIIEIYNDIVAGYKLNKRGYRIWKLKKRLYLCCCTLYIYKIGGIYNMTKKQAIANIIKLILFTILQIFVDTLRHICRKY